MDVCVYVWMYIYYMYDVYVCICMNVGKYVVFIVYHCIDKHQSHKIKKKFNSVYLFSFIPVMNLIVYANNPESSQETGQGDIELTNFTSACALRMAVFHFNDVCLMLVNVYLSSFSNL